MKVQVKMNSGKDNQAQFPQSIKKKKSNRKP